MADNIKNKTISGLIWQYAEKCGAEIILFIVSIILARILTPEDYGVIGLITVFISIANVFATSGMGQALVQRKDPDSTDYSTVFFYSIVFSIILYVILFFTAPLIAGFYNEDVLVPVIRVLGLTVIINAINSVQTAYVQKTMQFKRFFYSSLVGTILSAVIGIVMAYSGCGVWALVGQQLSSRLINTVVLWMTVGWRPEWKFSFKKMGKLFSFGWKLLCSNLIDTVYKNIYSLTIGKFYSAGDLGFYNRGKQFPLLIINNINASINTVLFPVLAGAQDEKERLKAMTRRSIVTSTFLIFPAMAGLTVIAEPLVRVLLTDKWLPAVPFIQFCCFTYAFWPVNTANLQGIKALGKSGTLLWLEIIKKAIGIITLVATLPLGLMVMMTVRCVTTLFSTFINAYPNKKLMGYTYLEQIKDLLPSLILSLVMMGAIYPITLTPMAPILQIAVQVIVGVVLYFGLSKLFKVECLDYIIKTMKGYISKR